MKGHQGHQQGHLRTHPYYHSKEQKKVQHLYSGFPKPLTGNREQMQWIRGQHIVQKQISGHQVQQQMGQGQQNMSLHPGQSQLHSWQQQQMPSLHPGQQQLTELHPGQKQFTGLPPRQQRMPPLYPGHQSMQPWYSGQQQMQTSYPGQQMTGLHQQQMTSNNYQAHNMMPEYAKQYISPQCNKNQRQMSYNSTTTSAYTGQNTSQNQNTSPLQHGPNIQWLNYSHNENACSPGLPCSIPSPTHSELPSKTASPTIPIGSNTNCYNQCISLSDSNTKTIKLNIGNSKIDWNGNINEQCQTPIKSESYNNNNNNFKDDSNDAIEEEDMSLRFAMASNKTPIYDIKYLILYNGACEQELSNKIEDAEHHINNIRMVLKSLHLYKNSFVTCSKCSEPLTNVETEYEKELLGEMLTFCKFGQTNKESDDKENCKISKATKLAEVYLERVMSISKNYSNRVYLSIEKMQSWVRDNKCDCVIPTQPGLVHL